MRLKSDLDTTMLASDATLGANPKRNPQQSDAVLAMLRPSLEALGFEVETGKGGEQKIRRPVLYGDQGEATVTYEIDAFHDELGIAVEVEAGRGPQNNADYRDLVRASLLLDARFLALLMPIEYTYKAKSNRSGYATAFGFARSRDQLDAIYASRRLLLPFQGVLLIGY